MTDDAKPIDSSSNPMVNDQPIPDIDAPPIEPKTLNENDNSKNNISEQNQRTAGSHPPPPPAPIDQNNENESTQNSSIESVQVNDDHQQNPYKESSMTSDSDKSTQQVPITPTANDLPEEISSQPAPDQQPANNDIKNELQGTKLSGGWGSSYKIVIIILVIFAIAGISFAGYQFYQSRFANNQDGNTQQQGTQPTPTPEPVISLVNGNVVSVTHDGQETILVNKSSFNTTGITGFTNLKMSPNADKICFQTTPPSPVSAVYISDLTGQNVTEVGQNKTNCYWLGDGQAISYQDSPNQDQSVNIYMYDITNSTETLLTPANSEEIVRYFNIESISDDGTTIICSYETAASVQPIACQISSLTGEMTITEVLEDQQ